MLSDLEDEDENYQDQQENGSPSSGMSDCSTTISNSRKSDNMGSGNNSYNSDNS